MYDIVDVHLCDVTCVTCCKCAVVLEVCMLVPLVCRLQGVQISEGMALMSILMLLLASVR